MSDKYTKEEEIAIMNMSPEEWQEYKKAHKQFETESEEYIELKLKLEAEKEKYINESKKYDQEMTDFFREKNLAEYERLQNEIIEREKIEYLRQIELENARKRNQTNAYYSSLEKKDNESEHPSSQKGKVGSSKKYIVFGILAIVITVIIICIIACSTNDDTFSKKEVEEIEQAYQNENKGYKDDLTGMFFLDNETDDMKTVDKKLFDESKAKLFYGEYAVGLLCYSRNINSSLFVRNRTKDGLIKYEPKDNKYYYLYFDDNSNKDNCQFNNIIIDYDNMTYGKDNSIYFKYEDFVINRSTTYNDVKNYFASKTDSIIETADVKKHMEITIDNYRILIDSYEDENIKPVGTVDKITVYVNR